MSPATAKELGVGLGGYAHGGEHGGFHQPVVELHARRADASRAPAWIVPGHADGSITVYLGYGRTAAGKVGGSDGTVGFNAYALRTSDRPWFAAGADGRARPRETYLAGLHPGAPVDGEPRPRPLRRRSTSTTATPTSPRDEEEEVRKDVGASATTRHAAA